MLDLHYIGPPNPLQEPGRPFRRIGNSWSADGWYPIIFQRAAL